MNDETINILILIVLFFGFMSVMKGRRLGRRHRRLQDQFDELRFAQSAAPPPALPGASKEQVERLEDRVRVLERIVTDRGYNLAAEIEALRDRAPAVSRTDREIAQ